MDTSFVHAQLSNRLGVADEACAEYIFQLAEDESMDRDEKRAILVEFLAAALDNACNEAEVDAVVVEILDGMEKEKEKEMLKVAEAEKERQRAKELEELEKEKNSAAADPSDTQQSTKKILTKEERKARERLLRQYGYEVDECIENENGEVEFLYSGSSTASAPVAAMANTNVQRVKEAEAQKKAGMQRAHAEKVQRDKDARAKQLADIEKKKTKTQKQEKRRM
ncbi:hypothetical protein CcCBS67573_g09228 [Chytriomyces confervae]|uniref:Coiled-coil domain-containing protein 43 n=1 Tax=Chytriomyces confervae TaxID=246404 RepID=A0A507E1J8_9FUNG|nr:hypothetical protein CcCBS67573_g09228 [Chytriomyces confervae]